MKIFITGCNSFIGRKLIEILDEKKIDLVGVDLLANERKDCFQADINDKNIDEIIPNNVDAVIHLAGLTRDSDCKDNILKCFSGNVMGTLNLIEKSEKKKAKQFIFASSEWVYDSFSPDKIKDESSIIDPSKLESEYALSKYVSELNCIQKFNKGKSHFTILRFGITYGPRKSNWSAVESIFNNVAQNSTLNVGSLKTGRNFIYVSDLCDGILASIGLRGLNTLNIQGKEFISLKDIISVSEELLSKKVVVTETNRMNPNIRRVDNTKAMNTLNWIPNFSIKQGLFEVGKFLNYL